jgi:uncharacterized protein YoxC
MSRASQGVNQMASFAGQAGQTGSAVSNFLGSGASSVLGSLAGPLAIAGIGMSMYDMYSGAKDAAKQAQRQMKHLQGKIGDIGNSMVEAGTGLREDIDSIIGGMGSTISGLTADAGNVLSGLGDTYASIVKSGKGLKTGDADRTIQQGQKTLAETLDRNLSDLYSQTGSQIGGVRDEYEDFMDTASSQIEDMQFEIDTLAENDTIWENII